MGKSGIYFVSGIDTDCGKTMVTAELARGWQAQGVRVITQKLVQTGCVGISEDILRHREVMGCELFPEDRDGTTCPLVFTHPCSPHLAARLDGRPLDFAKITRSMELLCNRYEVVLLEGAGGLLVPLHSDFSTADFIVQHRLPLIFVTTPRLGSLSQTLLALEYCRMRGIELYQLVYNRYDQTDSLIAEDTLAFLKNYLTTYFPKTEVLEIPFIPSR